LRCGDAWFAGLNIQLNVSDGSVVLVPKLGGHGVYFIAQALGLSTFGWDKTQVSICYPGLLQRMAGLI
jgi:hypothetical protein